MKYAQQSFPHISTLFGHRSIENKDDGAVVMQSTTSWPLRISKPTLSG